MEKYHKDILKLMDQNLRISPSFVANKLKVTSEMANDLCEWGWGHQCKKWFFMRNTTLKEDEIDNFINV